MHFLRRKQIPYRKLETWGAEGAAQAAVSAVRGLYENKAPPVRGMTETDSDLISGFRRRKKTWQRRR